MADIPTTPQLTNLALRKSVPFQQRYVPRDLAGAALDMTGFNVGSMNIYPDATGNGSDVNVAPTVTSADATGITVTLTGAIVDDIWALLGTNRGSYSLAFGDGTDTVNGGVGQVQVTANGAFPVIS